MKKLGIVVGSLRPDSFSSRWAKVLEDLYPSEYEVTYLDYSKLPLYSEVYDTEAPQEYIDFRKQVAEQDAILFVTPEYNRSIPGGLKNAIDVASRPWGESVWAKKPALVVSHSISVISGFGANHHLRQVLTFLDMPTVQQPEVYLANSQDFFDEDGTFNNPGTAEFLQTAVNAHVDLINRMS